MDDVTIADVGFLTDISERVAVESALKLSESEFRVLTESLPQLVWVARPDGWHIHFNKRWTDFTGLTLEESLGYGWKQSIHPDDQVRAATAWRKSMESGEPHDGEYRLSRADGVYRWMLVRALPLRDASGEIVKWFGTGTDIDDLKRVEDELNSQARQQSIAAAFGRVAISERNLDELFRRAANAAAQGLRADFSKIIFKAAGGNLFVKAGVGWHPGWIGRRVITENENSWVGHVLKSNQPVIVDDFASETRFDPSEMLLPHGIVSGISIPIVGGAVEPAGLLSVCAAEKREFSKNDIGFLESLANVLASAVERTRSDERVAYMANHDSLTDLPNRLLSMDVLKVSLAHAVRHGSSLALMFVDLDRFKSINDVFGHEAGDQVLRAISSRLKCSVRPTDIVSRQGGDEFLIVFPDVPSERDIARIAEKIAETVSAPLKLEHTEVVLSASIGIACFPQNGDTAEALVRNADAAMYDAKRAGRNRYQFYSPDMTERAVDRLLLEADMRRAIEQKQFFVVYQPQIDLTSGTITGLEALIRWRHPERGFIPPNQFIPIAEESGLISKIGEWVLKTACAQHAAWVSDGLIDGVIAVNVSPNQFRQPGFVDSVLEAVRFSALPPSFLELEVTEGVVMDNIENVQSKLDRLSLAGIKLAIDDFGTGYSSLSYLKQLPIARLKIDQSFTNGLPDDRESVAIVQAIVNLGQNLGMGVVAEGVETDGQLEKLRSMNCQSGQGYLFAKPLAAIDCAEHLSKRKNRPT